jgi:hypothetical protein
MPITFDYSSKVWQQRDWLNFRHFSGNVGTRVVPQFGKRTAAGWTSSLAAPRIDYPEYAKCYVGSPSESQTYEGEIWNSEENGLAIRNKNA